MPGQLEEGRQGDEAERGVAETIHVKRLSHEHGHATNGSSQERAASVRHSVEGGTARIAADVVARGLHRPNGTWPSSMVVFARRRRRGGSLSRCVRIHV